MLRSRTVFIVGAGASSEYRMPLGNELSRTIESLLDIRFNELGKFVRGDRAIYKALRQHCDRISLSDVAPWLEACWRIRDALPHHNSIDNLIDNHTGDDKVALCGKLAIATSILAAEKSSKIWFHPLDGDNEIPFRLVDDTWLSVLFRMLQEGVHRTKVADFFANTTIITFNYDRCIEHYFFRALQNAYGISETDAATVVNHATIRHVYGTVGPLPWQADLPVAFGGVGDANLLQCADSIRTYGEQQTGTKEGDEVHHLIADADVIVFLGFGYLRQNMQLLKPRREVKARLVLGSALTFSRFNAGQIADQFSSWFGPTPMSKSQLADRVMLDETASAASLLKDYGRAFA